MNVATKVTAAAALENDLSKIARTNANFLSSPRRAFEDSDWSRMKPVDRERLLHRLADLIERDAQMVTPSLESEKQNDAN